MKKSRYWLTVVEKAYKEPPAVKVPYLPRYNIYNRYSKIVIRVDKYPLTNRWKCRMNYAINLFCRSVQTCFSTLVI